MSKHVLLFLVFLAAMTGISTIPAQAQLTGIDTKPGDACTAAEEGHVRRNASAARDTSEITLICDGSVWQKAYSGGSGGGSLDFGAYQSRSHNTQYTATEPGLVVAWEQSDPDDTCYTVGFVDGTIVAREGDDYTPENFSSVSFPVASGQTYEVEFRRLSTGSASTVGCGTYSINFIPLSGGGGSASLPTCAANEILEYDGSAWQCIATPSGSGGDANTLDGLDSLVFLRSDTADTASGQITFTQPLIVSNTFDVNGSAAGAQQNGLYVADLGTTQGLTLNPTYTAAIVGQTSSSRSIALSVDSNGYLWGFRSHSNPGTYTFTSKAKSADDADTLDGLDSTAFLQSESDPQVGTLTGGKWCYNNGTSVVCDTDSRTQDDITARTDTGFWQTSTATTAEGWPQTTGTWYHLLSSTHSNTSNYYAMQFAGSFYNNSDLFYRATNNSGTAAWSKVWNEANDGSGSGLDADTLDGLDSSALGPDNLGNHTATTTLNMATNKITNVVDPTAAQDAATKAYVDAQVAAGGGSVVNPSDCVDGVAPVWSSTDGGLKCPVDSTNPVWSTAAGTVATISVSTALNTTVTATDDSGSVSYSKQAGDSWISVNSSSGALTGTAPGTPGTYSITVRAQDPSGNYVDRAFDVVVQSCPGDSVGGYCWFLGNGGESCDTVCANHSMTYDVATRDYAGSGGSDAGCQAVMAAIYPSASWNGADYGDCRPDAPGCMYDTAYSDFGRCTLSATTSTWSASWSRRACACQ